jgi:hypothetical protein
MTRAERDDMTELTRLPSFRRFMLRRLDQAGVHASYQPNGRSLEYREGQREVVLSMLGECADVHPASRNNHAGAIAATLIQILSEADQTARKEIARGGSRNLDDGSDGAGSGDDGSDRA